MTKYSAMSGIILLFLLFMPGWVLADNASVGTVAESLMTPVTIVSTFVSSGSLVIGITCLFAAFVKYMQYRVNPLASPIGTVVLLFVMGIVLVLLPLVYKLTESGIPFSYHIEQP